LAQLGTPNHHTIISHPALIDHAASPSVVAMQACQNSQQQLLGLHICISQSDWHAGMLD
jgi:hypothetical protein